MGGRDTDIVLLDENGIRSDGRKVNETRKVTIKAGVLKNANGSAYIEFGDNKILVGVYGPRDVHPKHMSDTDTGILRCRYHMAPFSVGERKNPAPSRREVEIESRWIGFEIPDEFVVGYGIDYAQRNRNLPYIGKVRQI